MLLLISDANIIIDLEAGELLELIFDLPYRFAMPDVLFAEEIEAGCPDLPEKGLGTFVVSADYVQYAMDLGTQYGQEPGMNDRLALALAKQEGCPLLTGDMNLRKLARLEGVEFHGTLWLLRELIEFGLLTQEVAVDAIDRMEQRGRRLPWGEARSVILSAEFGRRRARKTR